MNGSFDFGTYEVDQATVETLEDLPEEYRQDAQQDVFQLSMAFTHKLSERLSASLEWRFTDVDSDFPGSSYVRNRYYIKFWGLF